jgi:hypothetical protein
MVEREMLRPSPIVVSGKLAANAPWENLSTRENSQSGAAGHPAESRTPPELTALESSPGRQASWAAAGINPTAGYYLAMPAEERGQAGNRLFTTG